jgi:hypothetical protein
VHLLRHEKKNQKCQINQSTFDIRIFADFDQKITQEILYELCSKLCSIGFRVVACVSDCGSTNTGLWTKLEISWKKIMD